MKLHIRSRSSPSWALVWGLALVPAVALGWVVQEDGEGPEAVSSQSVAEQFEPLGVHVDLEAGLCAVSCEVMVRDDLLEYLVVGPRGASHETLLATQVTPSVLNTALLLLGVEPGTNATWGPADPAPTDEELRAGADPYTVNLPEGDGFYLYVAWREDDEVHCYRMEDLLRNLKTGRCMMRHRWVYLGSRMVRLGGEEDEEAFAADLESNIINVSFFPEGNTLVTGALTDCVYQTIWLPNAWLLPPRGTTVSLILSLERFTQVPPDLLARLPAHDAASMQDVGPSVRRR